MVSHVVEQLFRREAGRLISTLTRLFRINNLHLAEDVVQKVPLKALQVWSYGRIPQNPSAWPMQVPKNQALDPLQRSRRSIRSSMKVTKPPKAKSWCGRICVMKPSA